MKKIIGILIGMLMLATCISVAVADTGKGEGDQQGTIAQPTTVLPPINRGGTTWYVGGSGPGNFTKIQDAIDAASDGDTIFVYDDSSPYNENVRLNKMVNLIGENKENTEINGAEHGHVITITRDGATLSGFTLKEPDWYYDGIILNANNTVLFDLSIVNVGYAIKSMHSNNNIIRDVDLSEGRDLIVVSYSNSNVFERINIISTYEGSFDLYYSDHNQVTESTFTNGADYVVGSGSLRLSSSNNNTARENTFLSSSGVILEYSYDNTIEENSFASASVQATKSYRNTVQNNQVNGKPLAYVENVKDEIIEDAGQVILIRCDHVTVQHLQITGSGFFGVGISVQETQNSIIQDNVITGGGYGILVDSSMKNQITNNTVKNTQYGVLDQNGRSNIYSNNVIQDNQYSGLTVYQSMFTKVEGNTISGSEYGIGIELGLGNTIAGNTITNNYYGVEVAASGFNLVKNNNIMKNKVAATFEDAVRTHWIRNYWGKLLPTPKIIMGKIILPDPRNPWGEIDMPFINMDLLPRIVPYNNKK